MAPFAIAAAIIAVPSTAHAATIPINSGNVPTTADGFGDQSCDQVPDTKLPDQDGWVFVLPGNSGEFVSVTAQFEDANGDTWELTTGTDGGIVDANGTSKAYIISPAGWTLIGASAEVTGDSPQDQFNLTHTCPGDSTSSPSPSPSGTPSGSGTPSDSPSSGSSSPSEPTLPTTGASLTTGLLAGAALLGIGAITLFFMRRRKEAAQHY